MLGSRSEGLAMEIFRQTFCAFDLDEQASLLSFNWTEKSAGMTDEDYKQALREYAGLIFLTIVIAGGAIATFVGLATAGSVLFGAINAEAKAPGSEIVAVAPSGPASASRPA